MFDAENTQSKIIDFAKRDDRVRAAVLTGSRANPLIEPDAYQDFDVIFIVQQISEFIADKSWLDYFGRPHLQQFPDDMNLGNDWPNDKHSYTILTVFEDGSRFDSTLFPKEYFKNEFTNDSLAVVLVDKDQLFEKIADSSDKDYHIKKPSFVEFSEVCNEFWWCCPNVAKALKRGQILYAKHQLEVIVRPMFMQVLNWKIGIDTQFSISTGKFGSHAKPYLSDTLFTEVLKTYADSNLKANWKALHHMMQLFKSLQRFCAEHFEYDFNEIEAENSIQFTKKIEEFPD